MIIVERVKSAIVVYIRCSKEAVMNGDIGKGISILSIINNNLLFSDRVVCFTSILVSIGCNGFLRKYYNVVV